MANLSSLSSPFASIIDYLTYSQMGFPHRIDKPPLKKMLYFIYMILLIIYLFLMDGEASN